MITFKNTKNNGGNGGRSAPSMADRPCFAYSRARFLHKGQRNMGDKFLMIERARD
jgi:hypothetical protein